MKKPFVICLSFIAAIVAAWGAHYGWLAFRNYSRARLAERHGLLSESDLSDRPESEDQFRKMDNVTHPLAALDGAVSWGVLAQAKLEPVKNAPDHAMRASFTPAIKKLDHQDVVIQGFMFPLDSNEKQSHFVLSPYPVSCPYCLPAGPNELVEVFSDKPVKFNYEALALKGDFELLTESDQIRDGMMYRLKDAQIYRK